jgi:hypothetical protein
MGSFRPAGIGFGAALRAEKRQMRYLVSEVCAEEEAVRTCGWCAQPTCILHLVLGVGVYIGMTVLYFFGSRIATVSGLFVKRHSRVTVCCAGPSKVSEAPTVHSFQIYSSSVPSRFPYPSTSNLPFPVPWPLPYRCLLYGPSSPGAPLTRC